jgi:predicted nuclease of predicted toxin-antitoxin system
MKLWIDAQLPPTLATWLNSNFEVEASALRELGLRDAQDTEIFNAARDANAVIMTKDSDFIDLVCRLGTPHQSYLINVWQCHQSELTTTAHSNSA